MLDIGRVKTCRELAWDFALTAQMNVLYYQRKVAIWTRWDLLIRIASGVAASATVVTFLKTDSSLGTLAATMLGLISALASVVGAALKVPDRVSTLSVLLAEYTGHLGVFEALYQFGCKEEALQAALKAFNETERREAKDHPDPDVKILEKSQALVLKRIGTAA
jgi:hypothetical protein